MRPLPSDGPATSLSARHSRRAYPAFSLSQTRLTFVAVATLATVFSGYSVSDAELYASSPRYHHQNRYSNSLKPLRVFPGYRVPAESILLKDQTSGRILYEFESDRRLSPASLTKIMTALVILEHGDLNDLVTVSREAAAAHKIRLRLRTGQVFQLKDLVKAMLITSANDACLAAAMHVGGTEEQFVRLMNDKALALGLVNTHFSNACGFDAPGHYTTAHDLAALSEIALQHPVFRAVVKEERGVINAVNTNRSYLLRSTNRLLGRMPGIEGIKTGFTSKAGRCLIAKVSHDGKELLLVLLHASRRWNTATHLINYGLQAPHVTSTILR